MANISRYQYILHPYPKLMPHSHLFWPCPSNLVGACAVQLQVYALCTASRTSLLPSLWGVCMNILAQHLVENGGWRWKGKLNGNKSVLVHLPCSALPQPSWHTCPAPVIRTTQHMPTHLSFEQTYLWLVAIKGGSLFSHWAHTPLCQIVAKRPVVYATLVL